MSHQSISNTISHHTNTKSNRNMNKFRAFPPSKIRTNMKQMIKYRWFHGCLQGLQSMERLDRTVKNRQNSKTVWLRLPDEKIDQVNAISNKLSCTKTVTIDLTAYVQGYGFLIVDSNRVLENERVVNLCRNLQKFRTLKSLNLSASHCDRVKDRGFMRINDAVHKLTELNEVALNLNNSEATDKAIIDLTRKLARKPNLKLFHLYLVQCPNITGISLEALSTELPKVKELEILEMRVQECTKIPKNAFVDFASSIANLQNLKQISLNFGKCNAVTDNVLMSLGESLVNLKHLRKLDLNFHSCPLIRDKGLEALSFGIAYLRPLSHLILAFNYCVHITDDGFKTLSANVSQLRRLKALQLEFENCDGISDESIFSLRPLCMLDMLGSVQLEFRRCELITSEGFNLINSLQKGRTQHRRLLVPSGKLGQTLA